MAAAPAAAAAAPPMPKEIEITPDVVTFFCGNAGKVRYLVTTVVVDRSRYSNWRMLYLFIAVYVLRHQNRQQRSETSCLQGDLPYSSIDWPTVSPLQIRCTSANVFRVQPPVGFVPAGGTLIVRLWFQNRRFIVSGKRRPTTPHTISGIDEALLRCTHHLQRHGCSADGSIRQ